MSCFSIRIGATLALGLTVLAPHAQPAPPARPDPLDAAAVVPRAQHESVFKSYRRLGEIQPTPWRQANDTVERIGGWRAYAREANQPDAPAAASAPAQRGEPAQPAAGHGVQKH